jgi:hypothetical protein
MSDVLTNEELVTVLAWRRECGDDFDPVMKIIGRVAAMARSAPTEKRLRELASKWRAAAAEHKETAKGCMTGSEYFNLLHAQYLDAHADELEKLLNEVEP